METIDTNQLTALVRSAIFDAASRLTMPAKRISYTFRDAAEATGLPWTQIRDAHSRGEFKATKKGKSWVVTHDELLRWVRT